MSAVDEHLATRRAAGLFDFSFMGLYEFNNEPELQALQTRNLDALAPGQVAYTLLLKDDGAVLIDATVWRLDAERFWLFTGKRDPYGGRDRSGKFAILAVQGPASGRILAKLIGADAVVSLNYFHFGTFRNVIVGRMGYSGELGYELLVPADEEPALRHRLLHLGAGDGLRECTWDAADSLRIESGYVLFGREVDGRANPRELGLERFAPNRTFDVARRLVGLELLNEQGLAGMPAAQLTSTCFSPTLGRTIGLGFANSDPGSLVRLADRHTARVARLPFYDPERRRPRASPL
ncbi:MAG TPA: aminomethyltransferase family protein [Burkholderiales bacterium]|nr:aminomethyltransferase family protein [Burkholderiales bacterium]